MTENKRFTFTQDTLAKADVFDNNEFVCCTLSVWVEQLVDLLNELNDENKELKAELQRIYDVSTVNKVKSIVDEIYDDLLYETSEESDYARKMVLKCLEKIDNFGDDLDD